MKIKLLTLTTVAAFLLSATVACDNKKKSRDYDDDEDDIELDDELFDDEDEDEDEDDDAQSFTVKTVKYNQTNEDAEVEIEFDYPTGDNRVADSARAFITGIEGKEGYAGSLRDAQAYIDYIGPKVFEQWTEGHRSDQESMNEDLEEGDDPVVLPRYGHWVSVSMECDEPKYVSFRYSANEYMGGAHGLPSMFGATFSKADGHRLGSILKNTDAAAFHRLLIDGAKSYFTEGGNDDLDEYLLISSADLTVPNAAPFLTRKGVCFIYGAYEIAPYAAGLPEFTIPYDKIRPYLTKEALRLLDD